ncbi:hypothetical protein GCM10010873_23260 [Cypionkella aquatica]|uniref:Secreted protein n=1 Tax=Cypionkella aquatica TaxID=1756042 RepID=A0AA37TTW5_9RHOB|nr:hypothetical protein [Cypionkella aquatica]GLS87352.1 hypothetical protein GCM10010873_23260 [Cypionkella aquatica]
MIARLALIGMLSMPGVAVAKPGTPGPAYFSGSYERIGRSGQAALLNDIVTIVPDGQGVVIAACTGPVLAMSFGPAFEVTNLMTGSSAGIVVECLFHNNGYNRPILTCKAADGAAFTLWPMAAGARSSCAG